MDNTTNTGLGDIVTDLLSQLTPQVAYLGKGAAGGSATGTLLQPGMKTFSGTQTPLSGARLFFEVFRQHTSKMGWNRSPTRQ